MSKPVDGPPQKVKAIRTYFNNHDTPFTMDTDGRILGGMEEGDYSETRQTKMGVAAGRLVAKGVVQEEPESVTEDEPDKGDSNQPAPDDASKSKSQKRTQRSSQNQEK